MSSVQTKLLELDRKNLYVYMSSILIKNENIPLFEEYFGQLDYDWLLRLGKNRKWLMSKEPTVIRYINKENLSLNLEYRKRDFYLAMLQIDGNISSMKKLCGSRARYCYMVGDVKMARFYFRQSNISLKTTMYYLTSYSPLMRKFVLKRFRVFG